MRLSIRHQIVAPFVVLVLFVGIIGTAVVIALFARATTAEFDGTLLRASMLVNDHLALLESDRLAQLRAAADTIGVPEAVEAGNREALERLLVPIAANAPPAELALRVLNRQGQELLALRQSSSAGAPIRLSDKVDYGAEPSVREVLKGGTDTVGDKYLFLASEPVGLVLYWAGPVRAENQSVVGAVLFGEPLSDIASGLRTSRASELVIYDDAGHVLSSSLAAAPPLREDVRGRITDDRPVRLVEKVDGHSYGLLMSDWTMRGKKLGYLAVALKTDALEADLGQIRLLLVLLFAAAALAALWLGIVLARRFTGPIEQLVTSMQAVSAGRQQQAPVAREDEIGFLSKTFNEMAGSLRKRERELEGVYFASLEALARAIDARDPYTYEHSARVAAIALEIADAMNLPDHERLALRRSGLLHDIGKIGVDDQILANPAPLTEEEWEVIRRHPVIGYDMLKGVPFLAESLPGVRHHHERWDGEGYPDRLKGDAMPVQVRIIAVADAFDAMTSDRPYRKSFSFDFAAHTVVACAGTQFDPVVVEAFQSRVEAIVARLKEMHQAPAPSVSDVHWLEKTG